MLLKPYKKPVKVAHSSLEANKMVTEEPQPQRQGAASKKRNRDLFEALAR